jgi:FtsZ-binding cell division protein ZapB
MSNKEIEELKDLIDNYQLISANYNKDILDMQKTFIEEKEIFNKQISDLSLKMDELIKDKSKISNDFAELKKQFDKMKKDNDNLQSELNKFQDRNKSLEISNQLYSQQVKYMNDSLERNKVKKSNSATPAEQDSRSKRPLEQKLSQVDNPSKKPKESSEEWNIKVCNYCRKYHREDKCNGERQCNMCSEYGFKCADGKITK